MVYELKNKVVLITGAASGIGAEVVRLLLEHGVKHVATLDIAEDPGTVLQADLNQKYGAKKVKFYKCDVTDQDQMFGVYKSVSDDQGYIDVVINNAAICDDDNKVYKKEIDINFTAVVVSSLKAYELMRKDQGGRGGTIINIASVAAFHLIPSVPIYAATKAAVVLFSRTVGMEDIYTRTGVRVVVIGFGGTETDIMNNIRTFDSYLQDDLVAYQDALRPFQSAKSAARGVIDAYNHGESGSVWLSSHDQPAANITEVCNNHSEQLIDFLVPPKK